MNKEEIKEKLINKSKKIRFDKESHTYSINGKNLISVSALVEMYKPKFDPTGEICARIALRNNITPREQSDLWKKQSKEATDKGTLIHQIFEAILCDNDYMFKEITQEIAIKIPMIKQTCNELKPYFIVSEQIIYNEEISISGTTDILCLHNGTTDVWDIKTDKKPIKIDDNPFNNYFQPPLQSLPCNNYYYYALKMSVYRYLLEQDGYEVNTLGLLHIKKDSIEEIYLPYIKEEVLMLIEDYKKKQSHSL